MNGSNQQDTAFTQGSMDIETAKRDAFDVTHVTFSKGGGSGGHLPLSEITDLDLLSVYRYIGHQLRLRVRAARRGLAAIESGLAADAEPVDPSTASRVGSVWETGTPRRAGTRRKRKARGIRPLVLALLRRNPAGLRAGEIMRAVAARTDCNPASVGFILREMRAEGILTQDVVRGPYRPSGQASNSRRTQAVAAVA